MRLDAHHHFWRYTPAEYGWIDDAMRAIRRDFLPAELQATIATARIDGVISVQARQSVEETAWLLELADRHDFIRGVVGWLPLAEIGMEKELERFAANRKLRSLRHVLQGEPDGFMDRTDFNAGVRMLRRYGLAYDLLVVDRQLAEMIRFVDRHPDQLFILDHIAKPRIQHNELQPWAADLCQLAKRPNVYCKLSGMVTEADYSRWTETQLRPYMEITMEAFGPSRLMFGSDWPVCLVACPYDRWVAIVERFVSTLAPAEQRCFWHDTACKAYSLEPAAT